MTEPNPSNAPTGPSEPNTPNEPDAPAPTIELVQMSPAEVAAWVPVAMELYETARREAGDDAVQAAAARRASEDRFFPDGRLAEGQLAHAILVDGDEAGWLWLGPWQDGTQWWVWDIRVHERFRRRGVASEAIRAGELIARAHGATSLGLNVFAVNEAAVALYATLGYRTTALHMSKELQRRADAPGVMPAGAGGRSRRPCG